MNVWSKKIVVFSNNIPSWFLETDDKGILSYRRNDNSLTSLHEYPVIEFDADIDNDNNLHVIAYSSIGLLIYYILNQKGTNIFTLSRVHIDSQRISNLRLFAKEHVDIFYTISNLPYLTTTLIHYSKNGDWSGKRILEFPPNTKSISINAEKNECFIFYAVYNSQANWYLKRIEYDITNNRVSESVLDSSAVPITSVNVCDGHYTFCKDNSVYLDGVRLTAGNNPVIIIKQYLNCLIEKDNKHLLLQQKNNQWRSISENTILPLCEIRGKAPTKCTQSPFNGFPNFNIGISELNVPLPFNVKATQPEQSDIRIRKLEEQIQSTNKVIFNLQNQIHKLLAEFEKIRNLKS